MNIRMSRISSTTLIFAALLGLAALLVQCSDHPVGTAPAPIVQEHSPPAVIASTPTPIVPGNALAASNETFIRVVQAARPAVVNIVSVATSSGRSSPAHPFFNDPFFRRFFGDEFGRQFQPPERRQQGIGSGVIVSSNGYILTNNHVIDQADEIRVVFGDKREFQGTLIGTDPKTDLAIIKIDATDLPSLPWGDSDQLQVGEMVLAVGNPFGLNQTVTMGIISAVGRANVGIVDYEDFIQTDAAINPGNSGGALVNLSGQLIGINTAIFSRSGGYMGIGFAIPSRMAKAVMTSLIEHGEVIRGWLGVSIQDLNPTLAKQFDAPDTKGVLVGDIIENSPAEEATIQRGDIIRQYRGGTVNDAVHLRSLVAETSPGTSVPLIILRDGESQTVVVKIGTLPQDLTALSPTQSTQGTRALSGITVNPVPHGRTRGDVGVIVQDVKQGSSAQRAGLRRGDILLEINRGRISGVRAFKKVAGSLDHRKPVLVLLRRGNTTIFLTISPE